MSSDAVRLNAGQTGGSNLSVDGVEVVAGTFTLGPIHAEVSPGETLAVVGRSASGKTLLLRALVGLAPLTRGRIQAGGVPVAFDAQAPSDLVPLRDQIGMSFQGGALLDDETVFENVRIASASRKGSKALLGADKSANDSGVDGADDAALRALRLVGLVHAADKTPGTLSGGMRRRVGLARALVNAKSVLLCDDVTAGLDPATAASALDEIRSVAKENALALVVTTHDVDVVLPRAEQVLVLDAGHPIFLGDVDKMASTPLAQAFAPLARLEAAR